MSSSSWKTHNFPLHWLVWHNEYQRVDEELKGGGVSAYQVGLHDQTETASGIGSDRHGQNSRE